MLENILGLVKEFAGNEINNNSDIPAHQKEDVLQTAIAAVTNGLKDHVTSGNLSDLTSMLSSGVGASGSNFVLDGIQKTVVSALSEKLGIDPNVANGLASGIVPSVMKALSNKVNDPNEKSFNVESVIGAFTGGGHGGKGFMDIIGGFLGK